MFLCMWADNNIICDLLRNLVSRGSNAVAFDDHTMEEDDQFDEDVFIAYQNGQYTVNMYKLFNQFIQISILYSTYLQC